MLNRLATHYYSARKAAISNSGCFQVLACQHISWLAPVWAWLEKRYLSTSSMRVGLDTKECEGEDETGARVPVTRLVRLFR